MTRGRMKKALGGSSRGPGSQVEKAFLHDRGKGDLWVFSWRNGDGNIGGVRAETLVEAKKALWRVLDALRHDAVMKDLKRGKKYDYVRFKQG